MKLTTPRPARLITRACLGLFAVAAAWFAVNLIHPAGPPVLLWLTIPFYGPLVAAVFWLTARNPALPAPTRRFWRHLSAVPLLIGAGQTAQAVDVLVHPGARASYTGPLMLIFDGVGLLVLSYALSRLPVGGEQRGALARVVLDAGSVALAAAVFIWHFGTRPALAAGISPPVITSLILAVLAIMAVFALAKAVLADFSAIDGRGLRLLAVGVLVGALAPMLQPVLAGVDERLYIAQVHLPAVFCLAALSAQAQWRSQAAARGARKRRRSYSLLPHLAVVAVDGLLLWEAWTGGDDLAVVATCAVALTAVVTSRQISALRDNNRLLAQVNHAASHDALTGLANRALFQQRLTESLAAPHAGPVTVALLDLDGFKQVNDTFGHEAGDALLTTVGEVLRDCVRPGDTAARLGGDEFVLVLPDTGQDEAARMAETIGAALRRDALRVRASIGLACGVAGEDPDELLRRADAAMYAAKKISGTAYQHAA
ncbi:GGDEF domain-containing protein [Actinoplanes sp. NBC_00393]|uniref:GGDEF domain-containing protein n=1 Tax=Actinoplanes sp. NBC_00393 TaxID=2975953 RepID=UPI002E2314E4